MAEAFGVAAALKLQGKGERRGEICGISGRELVVGVGHAGGYRGYLEQIKRRFRACFLTTPPHAATSPRGKRRWHSRECLQCA